MFPWIFSKYFLILKIAVGFQKFVNQHRFLECPTQLLPWLLWFCCNWFAYSNKGIYKFLDLHYLWALYKWWEGVYLISLLFDSIWEEKPVFLCSCNFGDFCDKIFRQYKTNFSRAVPLTVTFSLAQLSIASKIGLRHSEFEFPLLILSFPKHPFFTLCKHLKTSRFSVFRG